LPLPKKFDQDKVIAALDYRKDVDGYHQKNIDGYLAGKRQYILPGLSLAIWNLIASTKAELYQSKKAVIVGKSQHFTLPTKKMLEDQELKVEIVAPTDNDLALKTIAADILITAIGKPKAISADMVKEGAVVIDVGINKLGDKTVGDVDYEAVAPKTSYITPVPGGVGPMTVAMLLYNTWQLAKHRQKSQ
jgi:methylenetetrahydrofolate dehydrogenase (NADP+) / methenyltetrahydrofolate cyclohydrolase